jgi:hypothetical protein
MGLDCNKWERGGYDWLICQYRKGIRGVIKYYDVQKNFIDTNLISTDFSELFVYMYNNKNSRMDFKLINYIFDPINKEKNFDFVILIPALFELKQHYDFLRRKNLAIRKIFSEDIVELSKLFDELEKFKTNTSELDNIYRMYKDQADLLLRYNGPITKSTGQCSNIALNDGFNRLTNLFSKDVLKFPSEIESLSTLETINHDQEMYNSILEKLKSQRRNTDIWNNIMDAEHAAMAYSLNKNHLTSKQIMNIFTGSPEPLNVYEHDTKLVSVEKDGGNYSLPKCPIYIATRIFCEKELKSVINKANMLNSVDEILINLMTENWEKTKGDLNKDMNNYKYSKEIYDEAIKVLHLYNLFYKDQKLNKYFDDALRMSQAHNLIPALSSALPNEDPLAVQRVLYLRDFSSILEDDEKFIKRLNESQDMLYRYLLWLYKKLSNKLGDYDVSLLPPQMRYAYYYLKSEPVRNDDLISRMEKEND